MISFLPTLLMKYIFVEIRSESKYIWSPSLKALYMNKPLLKLLLKFIIRRNFQLKIYYPQHILNINICLYIQLFIVCRYLSWPFFKPEVEETRLRFQRLPLVCLPFSHSVFSCLYKTNATEEHNEMDLVAKNSIDWRTEISYFLKFLEDTGENQNILFN